LTILGDLYIGGNSLYRLKAETMIKHHKLFINLHLNVIDA